MHEGAAAPSYSIRSGGMYAARSGPSGRFLYHFPAVTEGDRKMMQLEKMKNFWENYKDCVDGFMKGDA